MTIQLTKATYVSGVLAASGSQHTLDEQTESYLVHIGAATWVETAYTQGRFEDAKIEYDSDGVAVGVVGRANQVVGPVWKTDASGNVTGLVGPDGASIPILATHLTAYDTQNPPSDLSWLSLRSKSEWSDVLVSSPYSPGHILHPSLCHVRNGFAGYRYWLAYTPYPNSDSDYENPCIAASNDLVNWEYPSTNPIIPQPGTPGGTYYNADTDLYYDEVGQRLVLIYREAAATVGLMLSYTTDGINWTTPVRIYTGANAGTSSSTDLCTPSLNYNDTTSKWEIIALQLKDNGSAWPLVKITSDSLESGWDTSATWTVLTLAVPSGRKFWNYQFRRLASGAVVGLAQDNTGTAGSSGYLYSIYSDDGATFSYHLIDINPVKAWYRATFIPLQDPVTGKFSVFVLGSKLEEARLFAQTMELDAEEFAAYQSGSTAAILAAAGLGNVAGGIKHADTFNRADDATGLGTSTSGHTYTQTGSAPTVIGISSNQAYPVNTAGNNQAYRDMGTPDVVMKVTISEKTSGELYMLARFVDSSNKIRIGIAGPTGQLLYQVVTGGSFTVYAQLGITPVVGDEIKVSLIGNQVRIYLNDKFITKKTCNQGLTSQNFGLVLTGTAMKVDNFVVTGI